MIISRTPFRVSFFGGGTDYPAWYRENGGAVLATTIDKYCYISCRYLPPFFEHRYRIVYSKIENVKEISEIQHPSVRAVLQWLKCTEGVEIHHDGDLPARSGLGSSSSFTVGLINTMMALSGRHISKEENAKLAIHIEQNVINENVGSQDQISAAFGGFNTIEFDRQDSFRVMPLILPGQRLKELESHLMLFFTGFSRTASEIAKSKIENIPKKTTEIRRMHEMVQEAVSILRGDHHPITEFGKLLDQGWRYKRSLSPAVSTRQIDDIYEAACDAGAIGGKILGAGGGGFLLLFVKPEQQQQVRERLGSLVHVPFSFENSGTKIVLYQPSGLA
jgi:D-glycero-alpha-D-manno-heptose-7-phosphate kinase